MSTDRNHVLIVDDEIFFLEAIDEILTGGGYQTVRADTGESALELAADPAIGVVVLDVRLPDMEGIQVLARIREMRPELSIIMLSASTDQEVVLEALRLGASDYLAKPLHDEELVLAVGRALEGYEANDSRRRLRQRIARLVEGMERLSQLVRLASPGERVEVLRQGIVDSASVVLQASRVSLMLADNEREWLSVVASRGGDINRETMMPRKVGEGASGLCFAEEAVLCVQTVGEDGRFSGRGAGAYDSSAFAIIPLVCLGVPVGVLCLTDGADPECFSQEEENVLRLLGMQVSEFLAADPEVEALLANAQCVNLEGIESFDLVDAVDGDAELARAVCDAIAAEVEPERVLRSSLGAVARHLGAAPVALYLQSPDGNRLKLEAEFDGGVVGDRAMLPTDRGLAGGVIYSGQLVAAQHPEDDARFDLEVDTASDGMARGLLCVPITLRNQVVGVLRVFLEDGRAASPRTAEILAASFSAAVRNILLYRSLLQTIDEVAEARRQSRG
jgi:DNA-binding response OmpR family regulator/putative methionine-R-sulfoxide reductase with GAF domain